jgi:lipid A 4'-phosphatase
MISVPSRSRLTLFGPSPSEASYKTPKLYRDLFLLFVLLALIPTAWTDLDLLAAGLFVGPQPAIDSASWWWVDVLNKYVPTAIHILVICTFVLWVMASFRPQWFHWRLPLAFIVISCLLGPGLVVNAGFKDQWKRARPVHVQHFGGTQQFTRAGVITDQCESNCSFVSGHVSCGFFFLSLMLVHRRRIKLWAGVGISAGLLIGFSRMSNVAHWLSDVLWAAPVTLVCSWVIWKVLIWVYHPQPILVRQTSPS